MSSPRLSQKEYAQHRRVSPQHINRLVREGRLDAAIRGGKIDAVKADRLLGSPLSASRRVASTSHARQPRTRAPQPAKAAAKRPAPLPRSESATSSLTAARARKADADAALAELQLGLESGRLLPKDQVLAAQRQQNANIRTRLRQLPRACAQELASVSNPAEIERLLLAYVDRQLSDLAADPLTLPGLPPPPASISGERSQTVV